MKNLNSYFKSVGNFFNSFVDRFPDFFKNIFYYEKKNGWRAEVFKEGNVFLYKIGSDESDPLNDDFVKNSLKQSLERIIAANPKVTNLCFETSNSEYLFDPFGIKRIKSYLTRQNA